MRTQSGFSAVELLVAIIIAVVLLGGGFQLYNTATRSSASARMRYKANNIAYGFLRQYETSTTSPCTPQSITPDMATAAEQLPNATATVQISCPTATIPDLNKITVTVTYQDLGAQNVQRSILR